MDDNEAESALEKLTEELHKEAEESRESWLKWSALLAALLAVIAAVSGLEASRYANEAMIRQIQASDQWNYYQAKGIKGLLADSEASTLKLLGLRSDYDRDKIEKYKDEQKAIKAKAEELADESHHDLAKHEMLSRAVTLCQVAIAMTAIAVLTRRRHFVGLSAGLGVIGLVFLLWGLMMPENAMAGGVSIFNLMR